eukprot:GHVU01026726.1.p1 GENE.GHVU01026726.1~~GHVU01026726.1.p1  ORF type:complete len:162 (+),score=20.70 GHVU01026726.1:1844-2329(+)
MGCDPMPGSGCLSDDVDGLQGVCFGSPTKQAPATADSGVGSDDAHAGAGAPGRLLLQSESKRVCYHCFRQFVRQEPSGSAPTSPREFCSAACQREHKGEEEDRSRRSESLKHQLIAVYDGGVICSPDSVAAAAVTTPKNTPPKIIEVQQVENLHIENPERL